MHIDKIPYIKVIQKNTEFYLLKLDIDTLKKAITFHFRDPYLDKEDYRNVETLKAVDYVKKLKQKGINIDSDGSGVQRRLGISRINEIKEFIENNDDSIFPGSIILSYNSYEEDPVIQKLSSEDEVGYILKSDVKENSLTVIDGQHRLAGLLTSEITDTFDVSISLFINSSLPEASKIFRDINGNQKPVNKSFIYDLFSNIEAEQYLVEAKLHKICGYLNKDKNSPFYNQIKMLGTGKGSISQSFFIEYAKEALKKTQNKDLKAQEILNLFYDYFVEVQRLYEKYWPVPIDSKVHDEDYLRTYSENILVPDKKGSTASKLSKTNGVGALFLMFPDLYYLKKNFSIDFPETLKYLDIEKINTINGTGKFTQMSIAKSSLREVKKNLGFPENTYQFIIKLDD